MTLNARRARTEEGSGALAGEGAVNGVCVPVYRCVYMCVSSCVVILNWTST
jgi:hypothetical protein